MKAKRTALALQGGAALGAYEYGVLKALYKQPHFTLDIITGVSIGAFQAAVLAGAKGDPIQTLDLMWRDRFTIGDPPLVPQVIKQYLSVLGNQHMYRVRPDFVLAPLFATSIYDSAPLHRTLSELIDLDQLNSSPIHVVLSAVNIATGEVTYFENRNGKRLSIDQIVASGSIAPALPMTRVTDDQTGKPSYFWDGAFHSNLPLSRAINLLEQFDEGDPHTERELIVVELFPMAGQIPGTMVDVFDRILQLLFSSKLRLDQALFDTMTAYIELIEQIDRELPADSPVRELPGYRELTRHKKMGFFAYPPVRPLTIGGVAHL
jgi:NTE family protein